jgi:ketosteroid isomerase-like protein
MSQENVKIVGRFVAAWARDDLAAAAELAHPEVEQHPTVGGVERGRVLRGVDEIRQDYERVEETWDEHRVEPEKIIDAGDRVVLFQREFQRGKSSGVELEIEAAVIFDLRAGRITRVQGYMDRAAALEAVGLGKQDA